MRTGLLVVTTLAAVGLSGCASASRTLLVAHGGTPPSGDPVPASWVPASPGPCVAPAGGRCPGPEPVRQALATDLLLSRDGRRIHGRFACGGRLEAVEAAGRVTLTYLASAVGPGAMSCALVPLSVGLSSPLGSRTIIDGVTGQRLRIGTHTEPK